jgi:phytoene dehydrogenase-like protein
VFTLYLGVDINPRYFEAKNTGHFFYTPSKQGETSAGPIPHDTEKGDVKQWLRKFAELTTYEISIPVLRDSSLAPIGKTGLIISALFDYHIIKQAHEKGWYDEFREYLCEQMIHVLDNSIYPGLKESVIHSFSFTPLSIEQRTANLHGAITGWAFTNDPMPAENRLPKIFSSTETPIPRVAQAGQWSYSPSGLPISILTGKLAADRVIESLKKSK